MKKNLALLLYIILCADLSLVAQVQINHSLQLTGTGTDAKVSGIQSVTGSQDAMSVQSMQNGSFIYAAATGSNNSFNINISPPIPAYQTGMMFNFISNQTITGPATLNVNNLGAIAIKKYTNQDFIGCEIQNGQIVTAVYDGTNFQITSVFASFIPTPGAISGTASVCPSATGIVYSISPVSGATGYNWTVPAGDTITANNSTSIAVNFGANPAGNITVSATNSCSTSAPSNLIISEATLVATGGTITFNGGYTYQTFTSSGTLLLSGGCGYVDVLVVAGGGGGGGNGGGGGGGGGVIYLGHYSVSAGSYSITVGSGGAGQVNSPQNNGGNSSFDTLVAIGGGGGGSRDSYSSGNNGGSGGGGGGVGGGTGGGPPGNNTLNQGNAGGWSSNKNGTDFNCASAGGGGGGAGSTGGDGGSATGGYGGNGASYFGNTYGGGGGGGVTCTPGTAGPGGTGGGGAGNITGIGVAGTNGLGGGGGGGGNTGPANGYGGNGGSGVVIIRYQ